jgi:hypothetical protein
LGDDPLLADVVIQGYRAVTCRGGSLPPRVEVVKDKSGSWLARVDLLRQKLEINAPQPYWRPGNRIRQQQQAFKYRYYSSPDPFHVFYHEAGHYEHLAEVGRGYFRVAWMDGKPIREQHQCFTNKWKWGQKKLTRLHVGDLAGFSPVEMVAEVYAGLMAGIPFPPEVVDLYRNYGGKIIIPAPCLRTPGGRLVRFMDLTGPD